LRSELVCNRVVVGATLAAYIGASPPSNQRACGITGRTDAPRTHTARVANNSFTCSRLLLFGSRDFCHNTLGAATFCERTAAAAASEADDVIYRSALQSYKLYRTLSRASELARKGGCCVCVAESVVAAAVHINSGDYTRSQGVDAADGRGAAGWPPWHGTRHSHHQRVRRRCCRSCAVMCRSILAE
jgi:hypothetical protein